MESLSWQFLFWLSCATVINGWVLAYFRKRLRGQVLLSLIPLFYLLQGCWLLFTAILSGFGNMAQRELEVSVDYNEAAFRVSMGLTIMPVVAVSSALLFSQLRRHTADVHGVPQPERRAMRKILYFFAIGPLCYYIVSFLVEFSGSMPLVKYASAVLSYVQQSLFMTPVLIGLNWRQYRAPVVLFLCAMVVTAVFAFAEGSRSLIFLPGVFFGTGVWLTLNWNRRLLTGLAVGLLMIPVFYVSSLVENVRREVRDSGSDSVIARSQSIAELLPKEKGQANIRITCVRGIDRMIMWSELVALALTPEVVPYRGFDNFWDEMRLLNRTSVSANIKEFVEEQYDLTLGPGAAILYGFGVSAGGTVPFPVLADGWSRAGLPGVVLFSGILCFLWGASEYLVRLWYVRKPYLAVAFIAILASSAFERMGTFGFVYNVRYLVMLMAFWGTLFWLASMWSGASAARSALRRQGRVLRAAKVSAPRRESRVEVS